MTDQSANNQFHASSFLQGHTAEYLEQVSRYLNRSTATLGETVKEAIKG